MDATTIASFAPNPSNVRLATAIESLLTSKRLGNCRARYISGLSAYLKLFARGREQAHLHEFDVLSIEQWFAGRKESLSTMASNIGRLSSLFGFCERRGWIAKNPCKQLERVRIDRKPPRILSAREAARLMRYLETEKPNELAFFTLALFAGVRPEELEKIDWQAVNLVAGHVTIDAAASKVRRRRIVTLEKNAVAWLKLAQEKGARLPVSRMTRRRYLDHAEDCLGIEGGWPQDCLRHSAASFLLALHKDAGKVAETLGNSPGILLRHYRELVSAEDALAFWNLRPYQDGHDESHLSGNRGHSGGGRHPDRLVSGGVTTAQLAVPAVASALPVEKNPPHLAANAKPSPEQAKQPLRLVARPAPPSAQIELWT